MAAGQSAVAKSGPDTEPPKLFPGGEGGAGDVCGVMCRAIVLHVHYVQHPDTDSVSPGNCGMVEPSGLSW